VIVLDASALVDIVTDRPWKPWVHDTVRGHPIAAPAHQLAEVASAVARLVRADELDPDDGRASLSEAARLAQTTHPIDAQLLGRAWALVDRIRILDGLYVALAERLGVPLVTTDRRVRRAEPPCDVIAPPDDGPAAR
jgi:predicted nucleic acid-binding protein